METRHRRRRSFLIVLLSILLIVAVALAAVLFSAGYSVTNTRGLNVEGSLSGSEITGKEVVPGSEFDFDHTITNNSTEYMYVFFRIDTIENAYTFSELSDGWTVIEKGEGVEVAAYGEPLAPDTSADINGTIKLDVTNAQFAALSDEALNFSVMACGIPKSQTEHTELADIYLDYVSAGGE